MVVSEVVRLSTLGCWLKSGSLVSTTVSCLGRIKKSITLRCSNRLTRLENHIYSRHLPRLLSKETYHFTLYQLLVHCFLLATIWIKIYQLFESNDSQIFQGFTRFSQGFPMFPQEIPRISLVPQVLLRFFPRCPGMFTGYPRHLRQELITSGEQDPALGGLTWWLAITNHSNHSNRLWLGSEILIVKA